MRRGEGGSGGEEGSRRIGRRREPGLPETLAAQRAAGGEDLLTVWGLRAVADGCEDGPTVVNCR